MKKIIFVRHGKSSWEYNVNDIDRPLLGRGIQDALLVSDALLQQKISIDAVYSSPAIRALHSCLIFMRTLGMDHSKRKVVNKLYDFSGESVLNVLHNLDNNLNTVMIFGHNHAFTHLVNTLGNMHIDNLPTNGVAVINFEEDNWSSVEKGKTEHLFTAKQLRG